MNIQRYKTILKCHLLIFLRKLISPNRSSRLRAAKDSVRLMFTNDVLLHRIFWSILIEPRREYFHFTFLFLFSDFSSCLDTHIGKNSERGNVWRMPHGAPINNRAIPAGYRRSSLLTRKMGCVVPKLNIFISNKKYHDCNVYLFFYYLYFY